MKDFQNNFTTAEQSKKLLALGVPANTADCWRYFNETKIHIRQDEELDEEFFHESRIQYVTPCWSLGRLIEIYLKCQKIDKNKQIVFIDENIDFITRIINELITVTSFNN